MLIHIFTMLQSCCFPSFTGLFTHIIPNVIVFSFPKFQLPHVWILRYSRFQTKLIHVFTMLQSPCLASFITFCTSKVLCVRRSSFSKFQLPHVWILRYSRFQTKLIHIFTMLQSCCFTNFTSLYTRIILNVIVLSHSKLKHPHVWILRYSRY